jgi:aryl-alcohol dehydrogenase-like predicted oxidoreductase
MSWLISSVWPPIPAQYLQEAAAALDVDLTDDEVRTIEEPHVQQGPSWF